MSFSACLAKRSISATRLKNLSWGRESKVTAPESDKAVLVEALAVFEFVVFLVDRLCEVVLLGLADEF